MINIAILGHGVVGSGVVEVLGKNGAGIQRKAGDEINIKYILDLRSFPELAYADKFVTSYDPIIADDSVSVVVEVMGGLHPAYDYVKAALEKGKSVVTSNKELVAAKGAELLKIAKEKNVNFLFEASVGGGIPIIKPLHQCLGANEIHEIAGILNGTTNFILTKMIKEGSDFQSALKTAQELGYAEANPAADVEGIDACRKICILAALAFGTHIYPDGVYTQGITEITLEDVQYAGDWGGAIKLIGHAKNGEGGKVMARVSPAFVPASSQLATVDDVFNGILVRGDATGDVVFYGKGAGKLPTASAVVSDIIDVIKAEGTINTLQWEDSAENILADYLDEEISAYIRIKGADAKDKAEKIFGKVSGLSRKDCPADEIAFMTEVMPERKIAEGIRQIKSEGIEVLGFIRALDI